MRRHTIAWWGLVCAAAGASTLGGCGDTQPPTESPLAADTSLLTTRAEPEDEEFAILDHGRGIEHVPGEALRPVRTRVAKRAMAERAAQRAELGRAGRRERPQKAEAAPAARERLREHARGLRSDERVAIMVTLPDEPFRWRALRDGALSEADREAILDVRDRRVRGVLAPYVARLAALGATDVHEHTIRPAISATIAAGDVPEVVDWKDVEEVYWQDELTPVPALTYGGLDARRATRVQAFMDAGGIRGTAGNRVTPTTRIRVGVNDVELPDRNHPGFRWAGGLTRFAKFMDCSSGACWTTSSTGSGATHGTSVMKVLAGNVEEAGIDPNLAGTPIDVRRQLSGIAPMAGLYYYHGAGCSAALAAVQRAVADGVDVYNMSWGYIWNVGGTPTGDNPTADFCGLNTALKNAADAGMLIVAAMGNCGGTTPAGGCPAQAYGTNTTTYPALRRDVLAAAALFAEVDPTTPATYDASSIATYSSNGGMSAQLWDGTPLSRVFAVADLAAPGGGTYWYDRNELGQHAYSYGYGNGTSIAAPVIAGSAALMREAFYRAGWPAAISDARRFMVNMLLMGDGFHSDTGNDWVIGMDRRSGAGRLHMHYPSSDNMTLPWYWDTRTLVVSDGDEIRVPMYDAGPEPTQATQFKLAMTWEEQSYQSIADITVDLWDTCPAGGGSAHLVSDLSFDIRKRIDVSNNVGGRCLEYRIQALSVPPGQTRTVHVAAYYHSGNPADH